MKTNVDVRGVRRAESYCPSHKDEKRDRSIFHLFRGEGI